MIELPMHYIDVVFPLNLGPLTYRCPENLVNSALPGALVTAPLKKGTARGVVFATQVAAPSVPTREIREVLGGAPALGGDLIALLGWMADYYIAPEGIILKQTVPHELFEKTRERRTKSVSKAGRPMAVPELPDEELADFRAAASSRRYQTFLLQAPSVAYEHALALGLIRSGLQKIIIVFPETTQADRFHRAASELAGERACILHSGIAKGKRSTAVDRIVGGEADVVVGTRAALFSPLKDVSLIMVMQEHNNAYKLEDGVRYHVRDAAVMRGFLGKTAVVLSSVVPSVDSWFNARSRKYRLITPPAVPRPRIRIINMRNEKKSSPHISKPVFEAARRGLAEGKRTMFVMNRRGYAALRCGECGRVETCQACGLPLVLHKADRTLRCHACGAVHPVPQRCGRCKGAALEPVGAGTQRIQEEVEGIFGVGALRFDSDRAKGRSAGDDLLREASADSLRFVIGTRMMTRRLGAAEQFSSAVVLNPDAALSLPDFRAAEKTYMELAAIAGMVDPAGEVLIQTRFPATPLYRHFRDGDYASFVKEELEQRKALGFPPYTRLLTLTVPGDASLADRIMSHIIASWHGVEALGPLAGKNRKGEDVYSILLKSTNRKALNTAARDVLGRFLSAKGSIINTDVDPC